MASSGTPFPAEPEKKWRLGFWSLIATQFQGAFNENGLKSLVFFLILAMHFEPQQENSKVFILNLLFASEDRFIPVTINAYVGVSGAQFFGAGHGNGG